MGCVVEFRLKRRATRKQAKNWLKNNVEKFPLVIDGGIGPDLFHGWRFIRALDDVVYFANCIEPGISEEEFNGAEYCA